MLKRIVLTLLCMLPSIVAHGADVQMGTVTLKLTLPAGQCDFDPSQAADKRIIDASTAAAPGNDMLEMSADCAELRDWRAGRRPLLEHMTQYQTLRTVRTAPFTTADASAACAQMRAKGDQVNADLLPSIKENVSKAMKDVQLQGQTFLGVAGEDSNGCYVTFLQKFKAETGKNITQLNMFFMGSIKDRLLYVYLITPYVDDSTLGQLLALQKANTAALKAANGL